jgi:iron complex outermembrane recepter protein
VAKAAGGTYPTDFLVFDLDTIKNTFNALEINRNAPQNLPASFNTVEKVTAVYLQNDLEFDVFGRPFRSNVGVRHVKTDLVIDHNRASRTVAGVFEPETLTTGYSHTLPSVSLAYDLIKDVVLRASAGKTIKRSSVSAISKTYGVRSAGDGHVDAGNPDLVPEEASSRDWGAEWYFAKGGVLALAGYDKSFTGRLATTQSVVPFDQVGLPCSLFSPNICNNAPIPNKPDLRVFTPTNQDSFKIKGLELAYQQNFSFLPAPFNSLGVYGSYTKNKTLGVGRTYVSRAADGTAVVTVSPTTVPLVPEDTYSISAYYEQGPLFLRLAYNHKSEWANADTGANVYGFQRFNVARGYLDASVGYKFSKWLEVRLDGTNLTNQRTYEFFRHFEGKFGDEKSRIDNATQVGRGYSISLRGSF